MLELRICEKGFIIGDYGSDPLSETEKLFLKDRYNAFYRISFVDDIPGLSKSLGFLHQMGKMFASRLVSFPELESLREKADIRVGSMVRILASVPFMPGSEYINPSWITDMWNIFLERFRKEISSYDGTVDSYFSGLNAELNVSNRLFFHLVENRMDTEKPFAFMVTYSSGSVGGVPKHKRLIDALREYEDNTTMVKELLSPIIGIGKKSDFISKLIDSGEIFHPIALDKDEAFVFLRETEIYRSFGVHCRIPNWWRKNRKGDILISFVKQSHVDAAGLMSCTPEICLGDAKITPEEAKAILDEKQGLIFIKGSWAEVDHERLRLLLQRYESLKTKFGGHMTVFEAMRIVAGFDTDIDEEFGVSNSDWISSLAEKLREGNGPEFVAQESFVGELRDYQVTGVKWLDALSSKGFGACLADDMGIGKTVQVLAYLDFRRSRNERSLIVVPASLIGNWVKESERFTPELKVSVVHGTKRIRGDSDIVITTYATLAKKNELIERSWDNIVIDEAQNIKNPYAKQTIAVKKLNGRFRLALTGTPVENSLTDLWSLFDFINPGLLGNAEEFNEFSRRMASTGRYDRLRQMISPFILRRLKTDPKVSPDLPEKIEKNDYVDLSKKQVVLYRALMNDLDKGMADADPAKRLGIILAMITKFKQVCNHPDNYLHGTEYNVEDSGKMMMLSTICEEIRDRGESVIVFTQYREMIDPLSKQLEKIFGRKGIVIHGGIDPDKRSALVAEFNSQEGQVPFIVLSLKTGGIGLNLVSANHVVHFDRWWNPSVENQATDRAYRIGQNRNVIVHKLICRGTIEEKIDRLINSKIELAGNVVPSEEKWMSSMSNEEIYELFRLE